MILELIQKIFSKKFSNSGLSNTIFRKNIILDFLPPYSPQLNPIERVWQFLKRNYLSFKLYEKIEDIILAGSKVCNNLTNEIIKSIGFLQLEKFKVIKT
ncbi:hypothetical protein Spiro2_001995 [Spirobacillus cienkowskii]